MAHEAAAMRRPLRMQTKATNGKDCLSPQVVDRTKWDESTFESDDVGESLRNIARIVDCIAPAAIVAV